MTCCPVQFNESYDSQMTTDSRQSMPSPRGHSKVWCCLQSGASFKISRAIRVDVLCFEQGEYCGDSQMSDSTGAYEGQSQTYSSQFSQSSEGDSQEKRSTFLTGKRGSFGRPPPCGPAASSSSVSVMPLLFKLFSLATSLRV